ncbi:hypothetical protein J1N35_025136 [Gossypium stocksii]|uniref:Uncharacterized protein n=1 Tax=Gossypium stocksii TaxID=47602 RepID=A0A9D3V8I4_9ROSI|nr:hypothetical protein J1N35_025136 [Gossypium stocksii]
MDRASIMAWTCERPGQTLAILALRELRKKNSPSIVFRMETKQKRSKVEKIRNKMGFKINLIPTALLMTVKSWNAIFEEVPSRGQTMVSMMSSYKKHQIDVSSMKH